MSNIGKKIDAGVVLTDIARLTPHITEIKQRYRNIDGHVPEWVDNYVHLMATIRYRAIKAPESLNIEDCDQLAAIEAGIRRDQNILTTIEKSNELMGKA